MPALPTNPTAGAQCEDHRAFIIHSFRITQANPPSEAELRSAAQALHEHWLRKPDGSDKPIWVSVDRDRARDSLHQDLLPVVDRILHGGDPKEAADEQRFVGLPPLSLNPALLQAASIAMPLNGAASQRIAAAGLAQRQSIRLDVEQVTLYTLATGWVLMVTAVRFGAFPGADGANAAAIVLEGLYALGHAPDRGRELVSVTHERRRVAEELAIGDSVVLDPTDGFRARKHRESDGKAADAPLRPRRLLAIGRAESASQPIDMTLEAGERWPSLVDRLAAWLKPHAGNAPEALSGWPESTVHGRSFTFFAGLFDATVNSERLGELAYRLSRRFGSDYAVARADISHSVLRPFDNICHAVATQGAAVAVGNTGAPFIGQFIQSAITPSYLPMALLAYHEYLQLRYLTQECAFMPNELKPRKDKERLQRLRASLLSFRLYLRFSHISDVAHHNQVHAAWRRALDLDRMLQELSLDMREGEQVLDRLHRDDEAERQAKLDADEKKRHHEQERRAEYWRRWGTLGLALGSAAIALHVLEFVGDVLHPWREWMLNAMKASPASLEELAKIEPRLAQAIHLYHSAHTFELWALAGSLAMGAVLGFIAYKGGGKFGGGH